MVILSFLNFIDLSYHNVMKDVFEKAFMTRSESEEDTLFIYPCSMPQQCMGTLFCLSIFISVHLQQWD